MKKHYLEVTYSNYISDNYELWYNLIMNNSTLITFFDSSVEKRDRTRKFRISREMNKESFEHYHICDLEKAKSFFEINSLTFIKP